MSKLTYYYHIDDFPQLKILVDNWVIIRDEFLQLPTNVMELNRFGKSHKDMLGEMASYLMKGNEYGWVQGWGKNGPNLDWIQYGIIANDRPIPFMGNYMNKTVDLLKSLQGIKVAGLATLKPHSSLPCHRHPEIAEESLLQFHLPIKTSRERNYAYLNVGGTFCQHICGEPIIFDGSNDHFVLNESDEDRTILYMEFKK